MIQSHTHTSPLRKKGVTLSARYAAVLATTIMAAAPLMAADLVVTGGSTKQLTTGTTSYNNVDLTRGVIIGNQNNRTLSVSNSIIVQSGTIGTSSRQVKISGSAGLTKTTAGTVYLTGRSDYQGDTDIQGGTLVLGEHSASLNSHYILSSTSTLDLRGDNAISQLTGSGTVKLHKNELEIGTDDAGNYTFAGIFEGDAKQRGHGHGNSGAEIIKTGNSLLTLTGNSTNYHGDLTIKEGAVWIGDGVSGSLSAKNITLSSSNTSLAFQLAGESTVYSDIYLAKGSAVGALQSGTTTFRGDLDGRGDFFQVGDGRTIILGHKDLSGTVNVWNGVLQLGDGSSRGGSTRGDYNIAQGATLELQLGRDDRFSNDVSNHGTVLVSGSNSISLRGDIGGSGEIIFDSTGTTKLYGYIGDNLGLISINSGVVSTRSNDRFSSDNDLQIGENGTLDLHGYDQWIGSISGDGIIDLNGGELATGYRDAIFNGTIIDSDCSSHSYDNSVTKTGTGTWVLNGVNTYIGYTSIDDGTIVLGQDAAHSSARIAGDVRVYDHGTLAGYGTIGGSVYNEAGGTLRPGAFANPGKLNVEGSLNIFNGSNTFIQVGSGKNYSQIAVTGGAYFQNHFTRSIEPGAVGNLDVFFGDKNGRVKLDSRDVLKIIVADEGVYGTFASVNFLGTPTMLTPKVIYNENDVSLIFKQDKYTKLRGLTPNGSSVADGIDSLARRHPGSKLINQLNYMDESQLPHVLELLSPEQLTALYTVGFATAETQFNNLNQRMRDVRAGSRGFSTNGLSLSNSRGTLNVDGQPILNERDGLSIAGWDGKSVVGKNTVAPVVEGSRWGFFATGNGEWADVESTKDARGSDFTTGGFTLGADYRVSNSLVVGISAGYANTTSNLWGNGKTEVNGAKLNLYSTYFNDNGLYVNGVVGGGYNSYDTKRSTLGGDARGNTNGGEFNALLGGGWDYTIGNFTVGPVASVQYTYLSLEDYEESGSATPLRFPNQSQNSLKSQAGARATYTAQVGGIILRPEVRAQWQHEYLDSTAAVVSEFAAGGSTFSVNGPTLGRDSLIVDAGVTAEINPRLSVYAFYTGEIFRTNYSSNSVSGGFRVNF